MEPNWCLNAYTRSVDTVNVGETEWNEEYKNIQEHSMKKFTFFCKSKEYLVCISRISNMSIVITFIVILLYILRISYEYCNYIHCQGKHESQSA